MSMFSRVVDRVMALVVRGLVEYVNDSDEMQLVKVSTTANEVTDDLERVQPYGLTTVPPKGSEAVILFLNGDKQQGVVIACDSAVNRPNGLAENDVEIYSAHGQRILLDVTGHVNVGDGTDFVAMALPLNTYLDSVGQAVAPGGVPVVTPAVGATCPVASAINAAHIANAGGPPPTPVSFNSTNLRAD